MPRRPRRPRQDLQRESAANRAYKSLRRLPLHARAFEFDDYGAIVVCRGELYCRMRNTQNQLCSATYATSRALKEHLEYFHGATIARSGTGRLTDRQWEVLLDFYRDLMAHETHERYDRDTGQLLRPSESPVGRLATGKAEAEAAA